MIFEKHSVHLNRLESFYLMPFASYLPTQIISELKYYSYSKDLFQSLCNELQLDRRDIVELESDHQDENSRTVSSMNRPGDIFSSRTEGTGSVTILEEINNVKTYITSDTINGQFSITIPGDINSLLNNSEKQNKLRNALRMISGDKNATISKIEKGSIKITFNVSSNGIKRLEEEQDKILLVARIISRAKGEELDLSDTDLSGVDLSGVDLSGINFSCADLSNTNLANANLENADLDCADLRGADLRRANLRGTSLNDAMIDDKWLTVWKIVNHLSVDTNLSDTNLSDTNLSSANLFGANLSSANLSSANLFGANLSSANLSSANLFGANLSSANLFGANLFGANLFGANLSDAKVENARFGNNPGITEDAKRELKQRGAVFEDSPGDRSKVTTR